MNRWQTLLVHFPSINLRTPRASRLDSPPTDGSAGLRMARVVEPSDFRLANSNYTTNKWHMPIKTFASIWEVTLLCWNICGGPGEQQAVFQTATDWPTTQWEQKKKISRPPTKMFQMSKTPNPPLALKKIIDIIPTKGFEIRYFSSHDTILKRADSRDMLNSGHCHLLKKRKKESWVWPCFLTSHCSTLLDSFPPESSITLRISSSSFSAFAASSLESLSCLQMKHNWQPADETLRPRMKRFFFFFLLYRKNNKACRL